MTRDRFRAADPSEGRSLRNDPGVEAANRRRRSIAVSVMLAGASWSRFFAKAEDAARAVASRPSKRKSAHRGLSAGLAFHAHGAGKNSAASSRRRKHDIHVTLTSAIRRRPCLS
jgi:hypothetical protein